MNSKLCAIIAGIVAFSCNQPAPAPLHEESIEDLKARVFVVASEQVRYQARLLEDDKCARTFHHDGTLEQVSYVWWCSGFYPGTLWYVYKNTGNEDVFDLAREKTDDIEYLKEFTDNHDIGFQINCSFGNAYEAEKRKADRDIMVRAAESLITRFDPTVGCIRSWNGQHYRVIIDNMMNLELLMKASQMTGDDKYAAIARTHANTTMANHFRPDYSSYHMLDYDPETGIPLAKKTVQGYADESAWARGQAWGLYGYTMMYRFTKDRAYLKQAKHIADYIIGRLPEDWVPFWDFDAPDIPNTVRDASAGAIIASALVELDSYAPRKGYRAVAENLIYTLAGEEYLAKPGTNGGFILKHGTGHLPGGSEIDVPLSYADYYFIEALDRL